jgi:opacity protein-like surface antigen
MQKLPTLLTIISVCTISTPAAAIENNYKPYLGINYAHDIINVERFHSHNNSGSVTLGSVYNKYFDTEIFYQYSYKQKHSIATEAKSANFYGYGLDILACLPLGQSEKFSLVATGGIGYYTIKTSFHHAKATRDNGWGYRFGGGISYSFDESLSIRLLSRHIEIDKVKGYDHSLEHSVGMRYVFHY